MRWKSCVRSVTGTPWRGNSSLVARRVGRQSTVRNRLLKRLTPQHRARCQSGETRNRSAAHDQQSTPELRKSRRITLFHPLLPSVCFWPLRNCAQPLPALRPNRASTCERRSPRKRLPMPLGIVSCFLITSRVFRRPFLRDEGMGHFARSTL